MINERTVCKRAREKEGDGKLTTGDNDTIRCRRRRHRAVTSHPDNRLRGGKKEQNTKKKNYLGKKTLTHLRARWIQFNRETAQI